MYFKCVIRKLKHWNVFSSCPAGLQAADCGNTHCCLCCRCRAVSHPHRGGVPGQHRLGADQPVPREPGAVLPHLPGHVQTAEGLEAGDPHPPHRVQRLRTELPLRGVHQGDAIFRHQLVAVLLSVCVYVTPDSLILTPTPTQRVTMFLPPLPLVGVWILTGAYSVRPAHLKYANQSRWRMITRGIILAAGRV